MNQRTATPSTFKQPDLIRMDSQGWEAVMKKNTDTKNKAVPPSDQSGEVERDNDAHRPDGSSGTAHDSTAQKTARKEGKHSK
ncbi:hypothetical protein PSCICF_40570 [Pseudomonas cichorii]|nr:hypothetical protein PSCICF_40570 [Pseudomonas cichorii]